MTIDDQIVKIREFCDEMLQAAPRYRANVRKEFLWKIEVVVRDLRQLGDNGDRLLSEP